MWRNYLVAYPNNDDFWSITPRIYAVKMEAHQIRITAEVNRGIVIAYRNAYFQRTEKFPPSVEEYLLDDQIAISEMTDEDHIRIMEAKLKAFDHQLTRYNAIEESPA